ncbi:phospholipase D-like domain-containing protein [Edaphobacter bradus]|uniref:phospholipase D-like domain-containing protein n=1 Tax=Edaphobacter bradus TaxID=2259016 RepID=UPI0021DFCE92|nr:phospholipase D-like domain-containing protein [Edaphobacter bradus]
MIATADKTIVIASPFWDAATSDELVGILAKRLKGGVAVSILGRFENDLPFDVRTALKRIEKRSSYNVFSWYEQSDRGTETFHFKALTIDKGRRGYLGSANMTASSLRSRMELGIILSGEPAIQLDKVLRVAMSVAKPVVL